MKLPNLPKPKLKSDAGSAGRTPVRVPRAVDDLYRDMRDRRLLLPALLLIIAIVAVPMALSASKEPAPEALAFVPPEGAEAVSPAVLAEQPIGVRDYRERLDQLKSKNPFAGSFTVSESTGSGAPADDAPAVDVPPSGSGINGPGLPNNDTGAPTGPGTPATPDDDPGTQPADGDGDQILVLAPRIDVLAGPFGKTKPIEDVEVGDLLPDRREAPIAMFLGVSENLAFAHFAISDNVTATRGEGRCNPRPNDCEFLRLADGEKRFFTYGPKSERFAIKVTDLREEIVDRRRVEGE